MEAKMKPQKQVMYLSKMTPAECFAKAQVMIVNENGWWFIGPAPYRAYVLNEALPKVSCPIVDIRPVRTDDDDQLFALMRDCVDETMGVIDMAGLLNGMAALGAKITQAGPVLTPVKSQRVASRGRGDQMRVN